MSSIKGLENPAIATEVRPWHRGSTLPWCWPEGARVLLAVLAISAAVGLMAGSGRRERLQPAQPDIGVSGLKIDPNTADAEALSTLPHIGPTLARRIVEAQAGGPFRSPEDLRARVRGIGPATLARIVPYLQFGAGARPGIEPGFDSREIAIVDAGARPDGPPASPSRKPPRSRARKAKGSSVQLTAKVDAPASP